MKANGLFLFAFLISAGLSPAQSQDDRMITTVEMNQCWMEDMLRGNQEEQIIRIRKRLLMDTALSMFWITLH